MGKIDITVQRPGKDPFLECDYLVEIEGVAVAGFMECSEVKVSYGVAKYREGNMANYPHKQRGLESYDPITLKRGVFNGDTTLADFCREGRRVTIDIVRLLHSKAGNRRGRVIRLYEALAVGDNEGKFDAMSEDGDAIQELSIEYETYDVNP